MDTQINQLIKKELHKIMTNLSASFPTEISESHKDSIIKLEIEFQEITVFFEFKESASKYLTLKTNLYDFPKDILKEAFLSIVNNILENNYLINRYTSVYIEKKISSGLFFFTNAKSTFYNDVNDFLKELNYETINSLDKAFNNIFENTSFIKEKDFSIFVKNRDSLKTEPLKKIVNDIKNMLLEKEKKIFFQYVNYEFLYKEHTLNIDFDIFFKVDYFNFTISIIEKNDTHLFSYKDDTIFSNNMNLEEFLLFFEKRISFFDQKTKLKDITQETDFFFKKMIIEKLHSPLSKEIKKELLKYHSIREWEEISATEENLILKEKLNSKSEESIDEIINETFGSFHPSLFLKIYDVYLFIENQKIISSLNKKTISDMILKKYNKKI